MKLTKAQHSLLVWLGQAETSVYGECRGDDLDTLVGAGLATVKAPQTRWGTRPSPDYDPVSLTDLGRTALAQAVGGGK